MTRDLIWLVVILVVALAPAATNYYEEDTEI